MKNEDSGEMLELEVFLLGKKYYKLFEFIWSCHMINEKKEKCIAVPYF